MSQFFAELRRRHVVRAAIVYIAAVWALAQGISQLSPAVGLPGGVTRWFLIACAIGFPFWLLFAWYYKFTSHGIKRESEVAPDETATRRGARYLDYWIIGILALAVVLLLTNLLVLHRNVTIKGITMAPPAAAVIPAKSVAVLPFVNESGDQDQQYFSDGLSEDLITALSQFAGLKVISRDSSFGFRNSTDSSKVIGEKLGVAHLLEGSVRRAEGEVRIRAELVNANDGSTLWSQRYDRPYKDLFQLQDDVTHAVADALKAKLLTQAGEVVQSDRPPSGNLAAYNAFLQGLFYARRGTEADDRKAIVQFAEATRLDPHYALAYALMSRRWAQIAAEFLGGTDMQQAYAQARAAADAALRLNPDLAAAHDARGFLLLNADFNWAGALIEAKRAVELAPNDGAKSLLDQVMAVLGQPQQAAVLARQVLVIDPLSASEYESLSRYLGALGQLGGAESAIRKAIELAPNSSRLHVGLATIEIQRGDAAAALAAAQREPPEGGWHNIAMALALQIGPDHAAADAALKKLIAKETDVSAYQIAEVYALRKDPDNMFKWLDRAWANRDPGIQHLLIDPFILRYKHDPRFAAFCKKIGLPTTTDAKAMK